jgi:hypothetical protein
LLLRNWIAIGMIGTIGCYGDWEIHGLEDEKEKIYFGSLDEEPVPIREWESQGDCNSEIDWLPHPEDPGWKGGINLESFRAIDDWGEWELGENSKGVSIHLGEKNLFVIWEWIGEEARYWESPFDVWHKNEEVISDLYDEMDLLRVHVNFPLDEGGEKIFLPLAGTGGSVSFYSDEIDCE